MITKFWPSLKLINLVKIAKKVLYLICLQAKELSFTSDELDVTKQYSSEIISTIEKLSLLFKFPAFQEKQIFGIVRSLNFEVQEWFCGHDFIQHPDVRYLLRKLCWFSYGIIDKSKTAHTLIQEEKINIRERFVLSCKYYFDEYVRVLWENMSDSDKQCVLKEHSQVPSMQYRFEKLLNFDTIDSMQMFKGTDILKFFPGNYGGIRCYLKELDFETRYQCLKNGLTLSELHYFDVYMILSDLSFKEVDEIFNRIEPTFIFHLIKAFLHFPLQCVFVDFVNLFWKYISYYDYQNVYDFLLTDRLRQRWYDVDYLPLVKHFWLRTPKEYKWRFKKDQMYYDFERALGSKF